MGANQQSIDDTLEGSPTNPHPAQGWEGEKGAAERAKESDCVPDAKQASTATASTNQGSAERKGQGVRPRIVVMDTMLLPERLCLESARKCAAATSW